MAFKITVQQLRRAIPNIDWTRGNELAEVFNQWSDKFGINTPLRASYFLANVIHESNYLKSVEENLNYSAEGLRKTFPKYFPTSELAQQYARKPQAIANKVYANRMGNGSEASGDGWRYRGRGMIMLTGKSNYQAYQNSGFCVGDLVNHPEWLAQKPGCYKSAMWFWYSKGCNELADRDDNLAVTKRINGGTNGLANRAYIARRLKKEFGVVKF